MAVQDVRIRLTADGTGLKPAHNALSDLTAEEKEIVEGLKKINNESAKTSKAVQDNFGKLNTQLTNFKDILIGAFAVEKVIEFGKKVFEVNAQFQKLEAVLSNTLGSKSSAQIVMAQIQSLAAELPESVADLTGAFLKMQNNGLNPSMKDLRSFADLAANAGKGIDTMAEAVNDATRGEFERLKEFFIDASVQGDKVAFTFKNQTVEVANNADAIKDYLVSLGELEGVAGATGAVMQTLDGEMSNLGDTMDRFFLAIGGGTNGVMSSFIRAINDSVSALTRLIQTGDQIKENNFLKTLGEQGDKTKSQIEDLLELNKKLGQSDSEARNNAVTQVRADIVANIALREQEVLAAKEKQLTSTEENIESIRDEYEEAKRGLRLEQERLTQLDKINTELTKAPPIHKLTTKELKEQKELIDAIAGKGFYDSFTESASNLAVKLKLSSDTVRELNSQAQIDRDKSSADRLKEVADRLAPTYRSTPNYEALEKEEQEHQDRMLDIQQNSFDMAGDLYTGLLDLYFQGREVDFKDLEDKKNKELALVGDNAQAQKFINEKYAREQANLKIKQAQQDKQQAIFEVIINGLVAAGKAVAASPITFGLPWSAFALGQSALQASLIAARPIPKYKKGTEYLNGNRGTDTNLIWADTGERIVDKETNAKLKGIKNQDLPQLIKLGLQAQNNGLSYQELLLEVKGLQKAIKNLPLHQVQMDEKGFHKFVRTPNKVTLVLNNQFP